MVEELHVDEAFAYRDCNSSRNEFEEYYYWYSDKKREENGENTPTNNKPQKKRGKFDAIHDPNRVMKAKPVEKNKKKVEKAMQSNKNYFQFMVERGFK